MRRRALSEPGPKPEADVVQPFVRRADAGVGEMLELQTKGEAIVQPNAGCGLQSEQRPAPQKRRPLNTGIRIGIKVGLAIVNGDAGPQIEIEPARRAIDAPDETAVNEARRRIVRCDRDAGLKARSPDGAPF